MLFCAVSSWIMLLKVMVRADGKEWYVLFLFHFCKIFNFPLLFPYCFISKGYYPVSVHLVIPRSNYFPRLPLLVVHFLKSWEPLNTDLCLDSGIHCCIFFLEVIVFVLHLVALFFPDLWTESLKVYHLCSLYPNFH